MRVGDKVRLLPSSMYYHQCLRKGEPCAGKVLAEINDFGFKWRIKWENGTENSYRDEDIAPFAETNEGYLFRLRKSKEIVR